MIGWRIVEYLETHAPDALLRLTAPFWGDPVLASWLTTYTEQHQQAEDGIWSVIRQLDVDVAGRWMLERMAAIVGEPSRPDDTEALRTLVRGRIRANLSSGTLPDLVDLVTVLVDQVAGLEEFVKAIKLIVSDAGLADLPSVATLLDDAAPGGVTADLIYAPTGSLAFPDYDTPLAERSAVNVVDNATWSSIL